jgi:hypothetical protein
MTRNLTCTVPLHYQHTHGDGFFLSIMQQYLFGDMDKLSKLPLITKFQQLENSKHNQAVLAALA